MKQTHSHWLIHLFNSFFIQQVFTMSRLPGLSLRRLHPWRLETWDLGDMGRAGAHAIQKSVMGMCDVTWLSWGLGILTRLGPCAKNFFSSLTP